MMLSLLTFERIINVTWTGAASTERTPFGDWTAKMELLKLFADSLVAFNTPYVLTSSKYRMAEEEKLWARAERGLKVVVTPLGKDSFLLLCVLVSHD